jgi:hypothetical protein
MNMKTRFRTACICALLLGAVLSLPARAISGSPDYTALWWNASENGWGMNVIQQEQILFITLFVYGTGSAPTWYVASNVAFVSANAAGDRTYTGTLYATTGTPFSTVPFNPNATTVRPVGNITFVGRADGTASVQYTADSASVSKTLVRQTWAQPNFTLNTATAYVGASSGTDTGCPNPSDNGPSFSTYDQIALYINSVGNTMRMEITTPPTDAGLCTLQGNNYVQEGRYGKATLTGRCSGFPSTNPPITFEAREVEVGPNFFTLQYTISAGLGGCVERGTFTGAKK